MNKTKYIPDRTWKNIRLASNFKRNTKPVLSCKACPEGVSPEKNYGSGEIFLGGSIFSCLFSALREPIRAFLKVIIPEGWNHAIAVFLSCGLFFFCCKILTTIFLLLSFYCKNWVPAKKPEIESTQKEAF